MAISYLSNLDLKNNQLLNTKIQNLTADPTGLSGEGQIIYRTDLNVMKYHTGSNTWVTFGTSGGSVTSVSATIAGSAMSVVVSNASSTPAIATTFDGTAAQYISGQGNLVAFPSIPQGDITEVIAGLKLTGGGSTGSVTLAHALTVRTNTTSAASPGDGGTFTAVDSVTSDSTGHVTGLNLKTITLPTDSGSGVTNIASGAGLTGGPITSTGTLAVDYLGADNVILAAADGTAITLATTDKVIISDATDSNVKYANLSQLSAAIGGGTVTSVAQTHAGNAFTVGGSPITSAGTLAITMAGSSSQYIDGAGDLVTFPAIPQGDITAVTVTAPITGGGTSGSIAIGHALQGNVATTQSTILAAGSSFEAFTGLTVNGTGHVSGNKITTYTLPGDNNNTSLPVKNSSGTTQFTSTDSTGVRFAGTGGTTVSFAAATQTVSISSSDTQETYTLPVAAGAANTAILNLTAAGASTGVKSSVTISGTLDEVRVTESAGNNGTITLGLPDDVVITNNLTVGNRISAATGVFSGQVTIPVTPSATTDAASKSYVDSSLAGSGSLIFQGGYNASTNVPVLDNRGTPIAVLKGWTYAVTSAGTFYGETVEDGDLIIAEVDNAASLAQWTVVQNNIGIAGSGATDGATTKGIAGFDNSSFTVTTNGFVELINRSTSGGYGSATETVTLGINSDGIVTTASEKDIAIPASQVTNFCSAVEACVASGVNYSADIGDGSATSYAISHGLASQQVTVQMYDNTTFETVYADVVRTSASVVTVTTTLALATNAVKVLISRIN